MLGSRLLFVKKLFLDFRRDGGGLWPYKGCLMSVSCLDFSVLALASRRISGGAIPASLYNEGSDVCRRDPDLLLGGGLEG